MAWIAVITAGLLEVGFATMLKLSNNFTKIWPVRISQHFNFSHFRLLARLFFSLSGNDFIFKLFGRIRSCPT
jgi:multidrug transporter EmrE-like cation transporter